MNTLHSPLRTVEVARRAGCSVQQVRNLERDGVIRPAGRTPAGYRAYTEIHALAAVAYTALAAGIGPIQAKTVMRAALQSPMGELLGLLDAAHARLHVERRDVTATRRAVAAISTELMDRPHPTDSMSISELADALGVRTSTLRYWESEGLLKPERFGASRARNYPPGEVRDARIVHQLRLAGHRIPALRELMPALQQPERQQDITAALSSREEGITGRSRALLRAAAALHDLVTAIGDSPVHAESPQ